MKLNKIAVIALSAVTVGWLYTPAFAAALHSPVPVSEKTAEVKPFRGKVEAVDTTANTLTVGGKAYSISANTKLTKTGKTITLGEIAVGDQVHGLAKLTADGKSAATMVMVVPAPK
ncbi:MAG TPA: DUF5666 domain-containing protein [Verrucomicrobiae bacterium]|nr:DUF5666 domain-containing protein [Verrucomicrobiae bacterium]